MLQKPQTEKPKIQEFFCTTCKTNMDLEKIINFESMTANTYIPPRMRKTKAIGQVFTKSSILYNWHIEHGMHHDWGDYNEAIEAKRAEIALQKKLDSTDTI